MVSSEEPRDVRRRAAECRTGNRAFARLATGFGVIAHADENQVRFDELAGRR